MSHTRRSMLSSLLSLPAFGQAVAGSQTVGFKAESVPRCAVMNVDSL